MTYLDVLGQKDILRRAHGPYSEAAQLQEAITAVEEAVQPIYWLRLAAAELCRQYREAQKTLAGTYAGYTFSELKSQSFGDTVIMFAQLHDETSSHHLMMPAVEAGLMSAALLYLQGLAKGFPLRGGIDVEVGANLSPGEAYGHALCAGNHLESRIADSLRVVVGPGLLGVIDSALALPNTGDYIMERALAKEASRLVSRDAADRAFILDYLGEKVKKDASVLRLPFDEEARAAHSFLVAQQERWARLGELTRARKYSTALDYFRSRGF